MKQTSNHLFRILIALGLATNLLSAKEPVTPLTADGETLLAKYTAKLDQLSKKVTEALPAIDQEKADAFLHARGAFDALQEPSADATATARAEFQKAKETAEPKALAAAESLLKELDATLASDALDSILMHVAILRDATPRGLAEFAQQGDPEQALLDKLFEDDALMAQILLAGGANGGEYGEALQVYAAILEASERARESGSIFQRFALGTALQQPWLPGKETGGVHGIVLADNKNPDGPVARYLHYETAFLAGELDPAFKEMNAWECRFIGNDPYTNEDLGWSRKMLQVYRPDHIMTSDYKWRYAQMVKSDVPYQSPNWDPALGSKSQQIVAGGGKCGPRAFYGRTVSRAFGIPSRRSTQTGHAAMNHWTPDGWVVCFGGWWSFNWCGPWGGLDFFLDARAREDEEQYLKVLRAQWIGDAFGEENVSLRHYGKGGGFWDGLAHYKKRAIVANAETTERENELAKLTADEARRLGESDKIIDAAAAVAIKIPDEDRKMVVSEDGVITIPAAACSKPKISSDKIAFMRSWGGGTQVHYGRLGERPELISYTVEAPAAGSYEFTAKLATVAPNQQAILRLNRRTMIDLPLPYTKGLWQESKPMTIDLREGRNSLMFTLKAPNRGVSVKELKLKPVE